MVSLYRPAVKTILARLLKIAALTAGFFLVWWFVSASDVGRIGDQLGHVGYRIILLLLVTFCAQLLITKALQLSFIDTPPLSLLRLFSIRLMGESLAQVNPTSFVAGETMKAVMLSRRGVPYNRSISALTIARLTLWLSSITLFGFGAILFLDQLDFAGNRVLMTLLAGGLLTGGLFFIRQISRSLPFFTLFAMALRRLLPWVRSLIIVERKLHKVDGDLSFFYHHRRREFARAYTLSLLHWLGGATEFFLILWFLGVEVSFFSCVAMEVGVMLFKGLGTFVPGQIGIEEYANRLMLDLVGVPGSDLWVSVSILRRTRQLFWIGMGTLLFSVTMMRRRRTGPLPTSVETYGNPVHHP